MIEARQIYQRDGITLIVVTVHFGSMVTYHLSTSKPQCCKGDTLAAFENKIKTEGWERVQ